MVDTSDHDTERSVAALCVELWKLAKGTTKALAFMPEPEARRLAAQVKFSERQLSVLTDSLGFRVVRFDNQDFHPGLAASSDNIDEFDESDSLVVVATLEPAIIKDMRVVRSGRVVVDRRVEERE